jgi:hypothetical protein
MKFLTTLAVLLLGILPGYAQDSPHGEIKFSCETCHNPDTFEVNTDSLFRHQQTGFPLAGRHQDLTCRRCHPDVAFTAARPLCTDCHTNVHKGDNGERCLRCHTNQSWQVPDMPQKHEMTRFPLLGRHLSVNCSSCHPRYAEHQYSGTPTECISCHKDR